MDEIPPLDQSTEHAAKDVAPERDPNLTEDGDEASPGKDGVRKTFKSAVVIIPPEHCWDQIQEIRKVHDKGYERWMPHISMVYPFLEDTNDGQVFNEAAEKFRAALARVEPFKMKLETFLYFTHKKYCTLWLKPWTDDDLHLAEASSKAAEAPSAASGETKVEDQSSMSKNERKKLLKRQLKQQRDREALEKLGPSHPKVVEVQRILEEQFPECNDVGVISEKGFTPHLSVGQFSSKEVKDFAEKFGEGWRTVEFEVNEVQLISRKDFHDPFHVRETVTLGKPS